MWLFYLDITIITPYLFLSKTPYSRSVWETHLYYYHLFILFKPKTHVFHFHFVHSITARRRQNNERHISMHHFILRISTWIRDNAVPSSHILECYFTKHMGPKYWIIYSMKSSDKHMGQYISLRSSPCILHIF